MVLSYEYVILWFNNIENTFEMEKHDPCTSVLSAILNFQNVELIFRCCFWEINNLSFHTSKIDHGQLVSTIWSATRCNYTSNWTKKVSRNVKWLAQLQNIVGAL